MRIKKGDSVIFSRPSADVAKWYLHSVPILRKNKVYTVKYINVCDLIVKEDIAQFWIPIECFDLVVNKRIIKPYPIVGWLKKYCKEKK